MSRVARSARVASRQRAEIITGSKTISAAETGELFFINYDAAATITITLPPVQEGAYFRFQFMAQMANNAAQIDLAAAGTDKIKGTLVNLVYAGSSANTSIGTNKDDGGDSIVRLIDDIHVGSFVEIYCDGTDWQANGVIIADARDAGVFA